MQLGGGWGKSFDTSTQHKPTFFVINHKFIRPSYFYAGGRLAQPNGQPILAQRNFHTLYKSGQCSTKHELCSDFLVSYDRSIHPYI